MPTSPKRVTRRTETALSPWVRVVANEVATPEGATETWHCFALADYVVALAKTPSGRIPIVRQFRAAVNAYTWELPGGLLENGESPELCARRELLEETGVTALTSRPGGTYYSDTGRLENMTHVFFVDASEPDPAFQPEGDTQVEFVTPAELRERIRQGSFRLLLHVAVALLAEP